MMARVTEGLPSPLAEAVLDVVAAIPPGRVMTYGDVAARVGRGGARFVGTTLGRFGGGVPWHRVVRADGRPAPGHEREALARLREEGAPVRGDRVDLAAARWDGSDGGGPPHRGPSDPRGGIPA
jgi:alkylated DNA nucleotide flippase Atl1